MQLQSEAIRQRLLVLCSQIGAEPDETLWQSVASLNDSQLSDANKAFYEWYSVKDVAIPDDIKMHLQSITPQGRIDRLRSIDRNMQKSWERHEVKMRDAEQCLLDIAAMRDEKAKIESEENQNWLDKVVEILHDRWWTLEVAETMNAANEKSPLVYFSTSYDVICRGMSDYRVDAPKELWTCNMGRFLVQLNLDTFGVRVYPHINNVLVGSSFHPHVRSSDNSVCWGNGGADIQRALELKRPKIIMDTLKIILQTYNAASPYRTLNHFINERAAFDEAERQQSLYEQEEQETEETANNDSNESYVDEAADELF